MKVNKQMLHPDLRPYFSLWRIVGLLPINRLAKLSNFLTKTFTNGKDIEGLQCDEHSVPSSDGQCNIRVRVYRPKQAAENLPVMLYCHGGGYIMGNPEQSGMIIEEFIKTRPCVVIAPDYRKAYTKPYPAAFDDCYDTLLWAKANADKLAIQADKFILAGHSAGGGLTAALTLKARDTQDVDIAFQMPIYPMIDDKQPSDSKREIQSLVWGTDSNRIGWGAYLADLHREGVPIPSYAAPTRNSDYQNFPPTISFVGSLEPFYQETLDYVAALKKHNIDVAFELYEGCFHAFEYTAPKAAIAEQARNFTFNSFAQFYDKYVLAQPVETEKVEQFT